MSGGGGEGEKIYVGTAFNFASNIFILGSL